MVTAPLVGLIRQRRGETGLCGGRVEMTSTRAKIARGSNDCRIHLRVEEGFRYRAYGGLRLSLPYLKTDMLTKDYGYASVRLSNGLFRLGRANPEIALE